MSQVQQDAERLRTYRYIIRTARGWGLDPLLYASEQCIVCVQPFPDPLGSKPYPRRLYCSP